MSKAGAQGGRLSGVARHPIGAWLLIIPSMILGILVVELFCHLFFPTSSSEDFAKPMRRVVFLDGSETIFRDQGDIFTYVPHSEVRNVTGFITGDSFRIEYDYHFLTNNFGLVQDSDLVPERQSLLLLGDSFTEGQGADPWFRRVSPEIEKRGYQPVNGGLLGTGFEQWLKLDRYLAANDVRIRKLLVLFISADYNRAVWKLNPNDLHCLAGEPNCRVELSLFYRLPPQDQLAAWIASLREARAPIIEKFRREQRAAALLPASYAVYRYVRERLRYPGIAAAADQARQQSRAAIAELIGLYGAKNVTFMHLPQRDEIDAGPNELGLQARRAITEAGGTLVDGFAACRLTTADYYINDNHPNVAGYAKIATCATEVIKQLTEGGS